jgi:hypothetical protein
MRYRYLAINKDSGSITMATIVNDELISTFLKGTIKLIDMGRGRELVGIVKGKYKWNFIDVYSKPEPKSINSQQTNTVSKSNTFNIEPI